jgi:hypothetical protein
MKKIQELLKYEPDKEGVTKKEVKEKQSKKGTVFSPSYA